MNLVTSANHNNTSKHQANFGNHFSTQAINFNEQLTEQSVTESNGNNLASQYNDTNGNNSESKYSWANNSRASNTDGNNDGLLTETGTGSAGSSDNGNSDSNHKTDTNNNNCNNENEDSSRGDNENTDGLGNTSGTLSNQGSTDYSNQRIPDKGMNHNSAWSTTDTSAHDDNTKDSVNNELSSTTQAGHKSTSKNGSGSKTTKTPDVDGSTSETGSKHSCWWIYLIIALGILLFFIILIIIIKKCKRKRKRRNSIKTEYMGIPLITSRSNSVSCSTTPPIPMAESIVLAESPVPPPKLLAPPTPAHPRPSVLGTSFEPSEENYNPSEGIWSSVNKDKRRKSTVTMERPSTSSLFLNLPDVIISVPHSKHVILKQLLPNNKIYALSTA